MHSQENKRSYRNPKDSLQPHGGKLYAETNWVQPLLCSSRAGSSLVTCRQPELQPLAVYQQAAKRIRFAATRKTPTSRWRLCIQLQVEQEIQLENTSIHLQGAVLKMPQAVMILRIVRGHRQRRSLRDWLWFRTLSATGSANAVEDSNSKKWRPKAEESARKQLGEWHGAANKWRFFSGEEVCQRINWVGRQCDFIFAYNCFTTKSPLLPVCSLFCCSTALHLFLFHSGGRHPAPRERLTKETKTPQPDENSKKGTTTTLSARTHHRVHEVA